MMLKYNNFPYSAYSDMDGIKHIIGDSKTISFNQDLFNENSEEDFEELDSLITSREKLKEKIEEFTKHFTIDDLFYSEHKHFDISTMEHITAYSIEVKTRLIKRVRDNYVDERALLLSYSTDCNCLVCDKQVVQNKEYTEFNPSNYFIFDLDTKIRSEYICRDCCNKFNLVNKKWTDKDELLTKVVQIKSIKG